MPKRATPLTARRVERERRPGLYADGNGLYLYVGASARSWIFRYQIDARRRDMALGPTNLVSLAEARDRVLELRRAVHSGIDPLDAKVAEKAKRRAVRTITFAEAAAAYIEAHEPGWRAKRAWPESMRWTCRPCCGCSSGSGTLTPRARLPCAAASRRCSAGRVCGATDQAITR